MPERNDKSWSLWDQQLQKQKAIKYHKKVEEEKGNLEQQEKYKRKAAPYQ